MAALVAVLALAACGHETRAEPGDPDSTTTTIGAGTATTLDRSGLEVDDGVADPEAGEWVTTSGDVCPYGLVAHGKIEEAGAAPSIFVGAGIDQLRYSSACPFELLEH